MRHLFTIAAAVLTAACVPEDEGHLEDLGGEALFDDDEVEAATFEIEYPGDVGDTRATAVSFPEWRSDELDSPTDIDWSFSR